MAAKTRELIATLEHEWRDAVCAKDLDRLRALIHPRFVLIGTRANGPFEMSRDEWLEAIKKRELVAIDLNVTDAFATDDMMVGTVEAKWRIKYLGRVLQDTVLLTDVWICDEGRWRVVRRHSSPVPD